MKDYEGVCRNYFFNSNNRDGYLKHQGNLGRKNPALIEKRRKVYADSIKHHLPESST